MDESNRKHIILGYGGSIGKVLARELTAEGLPTKVVSRRGTAPAGTEACEADLLDREKVFAAVEEGSIAYLTAGLRYSKEVWAEEWPRIMANVVEACERRKARLIFFDNVYMYGRVEGKMTEDTPVDPCSRKGEIRAKIAEALLRETKAGNLEAIIARAADFYGPSAGNTNVPYLMVFSRLRAGKAAQWLQNPAAKHSLTYVDDMGKALLLLARSENGWGRVWHLPTASPALTGYEIIKIAADHLGVPPRVSVLKKWMLRLAGLADKTISEVVEMSYQNEFDYVFDSSRFEKAFGFHPTTYEAGIMASLDALAKSDVGENNE